MPIPPLALDTVAQLMEVEFADWADGLPEEVRQIMIDDDDFSDANTRRVRMYPHPIEPDGLPTGWLMRWRARHPELGPEAPETDEVFVIERKDGGWTMLMQYQDASRHPTTIYWAAASAVTVPQLHAYAIKAGQGGLERALHGFITSCYDLTDPVEAAEATLVGLGAPITVFPRCLSMRV